MSSGGVVRRLAGIGSNPSDPAELQTQKRVLVSVSLIVATLALGWGAVYLVLNEPLAAAIPWTYSAGAAISLTVFAVTGRYRTFRLVQLCLILVLPFLLQLALGGFVNASAVIIWSLLAPLGALAMVGRRQAVAWFVAYAALIVAAQLIRPSLEIDNNLPDAAIAVFFIANIVAATGVSFYALYYFVGQKDVALAELARERARSDRLLLNVLPQEIADQLKTDETKLIATYHESVSILFADLAGFTPLAEGRAPEDVVVLLNDVFTYFDGLVAGQGLEKIRTMGDAYMVASGIPTARDDHATVLANVALGMLQYQPSPGLTQDQPLGFRVGMSSGPAVAGVIGRSKFQYDVWGDTVNTASRMESQGVPGRIQLSPGAYALLADDFVCEPRGSVDVKGKGSMDTWFLIGPSEQA
jgi:adenylate cyclase